MNMNEDDIVLKVTLITILLSWNIRLHFNC